MASSRPGPGQGRLYPTDTQVRRGSQPSFWASAYERRGSLGRQLATEVNGSLHTLQCILEQRCSGGASQPTPQSAASYLKILYNHTDSYAGNRKVPEEKEPLQN
mmetsp:Transcript_92367/g.214646  ORF Transcript_92367/g.214646 Transcript_92367/m.214646 type:complete len:104 (+) Transcript_92367:57-368(+)